MTAREVVRRTVVWGLLAAFFVPPVWMLVRYPGEPQALNNALWALMAWSGFPVVGAVILSRKPGNWVGRLMMFIGLYWSLSGLLYLPSVAPHVPPLAELLLYGVQYLVWLALVVIPVLFPSGRAETPTGRVLVVALVSVAAVVLALLVVSTLPMQITGHVSPFAVPALAPVSNFVVGDTGFFVVPLLLTGALVELGVRWRRSTGARRLQFRWFAYGVAVTLVFLLVTSLVAAEDVWTDLLVLGINALPVSIGIAVTRAGLYEINHVVSRTVAYALVTALVVGVYALVVTSVTRLLPAQSALAVAAATLAAAGVFLPVLRRVQGGVDRRFDRERVDAVRVVDEFGAQLRSGADPGRTTSDLARAVERAWQPTSLGLWTVGDER